jgi:hypothetical protein
MWCPGFKIWVFKCNLYRYSEEAIDTVKAFFAPNHKPKPLDPVGAVAAAAGGAAAAAAAANAGSKHAQVSAAAAAAAATAAAAAAAAAATKAEAGDGTSDGDGDVGGPNAINALKAMVEEARYGCWYCNDSCLYFFYFLLFTFYFLLFTFYFLLFTFYFLLFLCVPSPLLFFFVPSLLARVQSNRCQTVIAWLEERDPATRSQLASTQKQLQAMIESK